MSDAIRIQGARTHNLKYLTVTIPRNKLVVITGVSGSGKSTLLFDILHKESQRQFMGAHGIVTDQLQKAHVEKIIGLSPSIAVHQHLTNRNPRSTVGTASEIYTYLRVLYARVGYRPCPQCGQEMAPEYNASDQQVWNSDHDEIAPDAEQDHLRCPHCSTSVTRLTMAHFSFNLPMGA